MVLRNVLLSNAIVLTWCAVGFALGPVLGGVVYSAGGYYAVFGMVFGLTGFDLVMRLTIIEKKIAVK